MVIGPHYNRQILLDDAGAAPGGWGETRLWKFWRAVSQSPNKCVFFPDWPKWDRVLLWLVMFYRVCDCGHDCARFLRCDCDYGCDFWLYSLFFVVFLLFFVVFVVACPVRARPHLQAAVLLWFVVLCRACDYGHDCARFRRYHCDCGCGLWLWLWFLVVFWCFLLLLIFCFSCHLSHI